MSKLVSVRNPSPIRQSCCEEHSKGDSRFDVLEKRVDAMERELARLSRALAELEVAPVPEQPAPKRRRSPRTGSAGASNVLPAIIFEGLRAVGISDTEGAAAIGRPRSTWSRVASGTARELGLDDAALAALRKLVRAKREKLQEVASTLGFIGRRRGDKKSAEFR